MSDNQLKRGASSDVEDDEESDSFMVLSQPNPIPKASPKRSSGKTGGGVGQTIVRVKKKRKRFHVPGE